MSIYLWLVLIAIAYLVVGYIFHLFYDGNSRYNQNNPNDIYVNPILSELKKMNNRNDGD